MKSRKKKERQWLAVQLSNWYEVQASDNPSMVPDLEKALVEKHNALPAWTIQEGAQKGAWYGVELIKPHSEPESIIEEMRSAGFEVQVFVLYGESSQDVLHEAMTEMAENG